MKEKHAEKCRKKKRNSGKSRGGSLGEERAIYRWKEVCDFIF